MTDAGATSAKPGPRFDGVDALRGWSILAVILLHIRIRMSVAGHSLTAVLPKWFAYLLFNNGSNGVTVFFAISEFLITFISMRRFGSLARISPKTFYRFRFARIAPLLLILLAALSALHLGSVPGFEIDPKRSSLARALFAALTFHLNWLEAARGYLPASWDILWSLSIEEMFYLFFPLVCIGLLRFRSGSGALAALLLLLVAIGPFARVAWTTNELWQEKSYLGNMDAIALGCLSALLCHAVLEHGPGHFLTRRRVLLALKGAGIALMVLVAVWPQWPWLRALGRLGLDVTILPIGCCLYVVASVLSGSSGARWTAPLRWIGRHSYEIYLTHEFVVIGGVALYAATAAGPAALWVVAIVAGSVVLGAVVARYVSEPLNEELRGQSVARGGLAAE